MFSLAHCPNLIRLAIWEPQPLPAAWGTAMPTIYVELQDEGVTVWRPVEALHIDGNIYRLCGTVPDGECWKFQPGTHVRCEERWFSGGNCNLTAVEQVFV